MVTISSPMFAHQRFIADNQIEIETLPEDIRQAITKFDDLEDDLEDEDKSDQELANLSGELKLLDKRLEQLLIDYLDTEEEEEPLSDQEIAHNIFEVYFNKPGQKITVKQMREEEMPESIIKQLPNQGIAGRIKIGPFILERGRYDIPFTIKKTE